jgi:hypothetical protein
LAQAEVDKTGASYYGKTQLHYLDIEGESSMIQLPKDGPIYHLVSIFINFIFGQIFILENFLQRSKL